MATRNLNVGTAERWVSVLAGLGLAMLALRQGGSRSRAGSRSGADFGSDAGAPSVGEGSRGGGAFGGAIFGAAATSLITRGATGYCPVKGALAGGTSIAEGIRTRWDRARTGLTGGGSAAIDSIESLYYSEVQELHSAEMQLCRLLEKLPRTLESVVLEKLLEGYGTEVSSRREDLARTLRSIGADPRAHSDQAMRALLKEVHKMEQICAPNVRDAALLASLQRVIHFKIAGYGTVASYAEMLRQPENAARFAECADRDRAIDRQLTDLAKSLVNPAAGHGGISVTAAPSGPPH